MPENAGGIAAELLPLLGTLTATALASLALLALAGWALPAVLGKPLRLLRARPLLGVFAVWLAVYLSGQIFAFAGTGTFTLSEVGTSNFVRLAFLALALLGISIYGVLTRFEVLAPMFRPPLLPFTAFAAWAALTLLWSTSVPATAYKVTEYTTSLLTAGLAIFVIERASRDLNDRMRLTWTLLSWHWTLVAVSLGMVALGVLLWPAQSLSHEIGLLGVQVRGAFPSISSNGVGNISAQLALVLINRMLVGARPRWLYGALLGVALTAMLFAQTRSALLGFALALLAVLLLHRRWGLFALLMGGGLVAASTQLASVITAYLIRGQAYALDTLSGRTVWWTAALDALRDRPLEGYGMFAGGKYVLRTYFDRSTSTLHNSFVEVAAGSGLIGLTLFVTGLALTWALLLLHRRRARLHPLAWALWIEMLAVMVFSSVRSVFSVPFIWPPLLGFGIVLIYLAALRAGTAGRAVGADDRPAGSPPNAAHVTAPGGVRPYP